MVKSAPSPISKRYFPVRVVSNTSCGDPTGMLGGFQIVHRVDIQNSKNFLAKLKLARPESAPYRIADCGAGIGRITKNFLSKINANVVVDIVEPVKKFMDEITEGAGFAEEREAGKIGKVFNVGLEDWTPDEGAYWIIWTQWCAGHLTDQKLVDYLKRCIKGLQPGGILVIKENLSTDVDDMFDELDSSVTRYVAGHGLGTG